ncbi:hypothetical protein [Streptosporangium sp. KLBMP 9127]|nr:hypothetical protein [Streptosporangium sp. KLBMP 9127]
MRAIAGAAGLSAGRVHEYMTATRRVAGFELFERISDGLGIPGHLLRLADRPWEQASASRVVKVSASWTPSRTVEAISLFTRRDLVLDRRDATKTIATLLVGTPLIESVENWLSPERVPPEKGPRSAVGTEEVERIEHAAEMFRSWDDQYGGGLRRKAVLGQLNEVADLLRDSHPAHISRRLFHVMSQLSQTAAMMTWDSGEQAKAQKYYMLALRAAKEAEDPCWGANILASMARQLLCLDRPDDALELIRLAQDGVRGRATPRIRAMLHTREAWAYAKLGRIQSFRRATGRAEEEFGHGRRAEDPAWIRYFDEAELSGVTGGRLLELAEQDPVHAPEARSRIERALALRRPNSMRSYALDQAGLAEAYFICSELEQGVLAGRRAMEVAQRTQSDRVRVQVNDLYRKTVPHMREPAVRDLRDHIRSYLTS